MKTYLIDFENVHSQGLQGISNINPDDEVIIFYTDAANSLTIDLHNELVNTQAKILFKKVVCGTPNALDFQLSSFVGYLFGIDPKSECIIISKDNGYSAILKFWKPNYKISQYQQINQAIAKNSTTAKIEMNEAPKMIDTEPPVKTIVENTIPKLADSSFPFDTVSIKEALKGSDVNFEWLFKTIQEHFNNNQFKLQQIYTEIVKKYKAEKGRAIYKELKPLLKIKK